MHDFSSVYGRNTVRSSSDPFVQTSGGVLGGMVPLTALAGRSAAMSMDSCSALEGSGFEWPCFGFGIRFVLSRKRSVAPLLKSAMSIATRSLSCCIPSLTASVPIGQSSISIVFRVPFCIKPIGGTPSHLISALLRLAFRLMIPGGPSK